MAVLAACRLGNSRLLTSSTFSVETKLSAIALSRALPVLPIDGVMPTSLSLSEKERESGVLHSPVRVMDQTGSGLPSPHRHLQGVHDQFGPQVVLHRPPDDPSRMDIQDVKARWRKPSRVATHVMSATQTLSASVAANFLFTRSSAGATLLARWVVPLLRPRMQPRSPASLMSLSTRLRLQRVPSAFNSACTLGDP